MLFKMHDNYLLAYSLNEIASNGIKSPAGYSDILAREKTDTLSFMNDHHSLRTSSNIPLMIVRLGNRVVG